MDEDVLADVNKKQKVDNIVKWAAVSRKPGMFRYAFSIIGHPSMDRERTIQDALRLKVLGFEINRASRFRYRTRYFTDSGIIGTKEFVSSNYQRFKHLFHSKHEKKPKPIKGLDGMYSLKRLSEMI